MAKSDDKKGKRGEKNKDRRDEKKAAAKVVLMSQGVAATDGQPADAPAPSDRRAQGKALRDIVPREAHAGWKARPDRRDPIEVLNTCRERHQSCC